MTVKNNLDSAKLLTLINAPATCLSLTLKEWECLILILRASKLLATFASKIQQSNVFEDTPDYAQRHLTNALILAEKQHKQLFYEAKELTRVIEKVTPKAIFLKGAAYTLASNNTSLGRIYSDIDLLVAKEAIAPTEKLLCVLGWLPEKVDDYDDKYYREWAHEIPPMQNASRGTVLDLHHNLVPPVSGKAPDIRLFTKGCIETECSGYILRPAAMTLHSAIHLFINEDFNNAFRDILDLHNLFSEFNNDDFWKDILDLASATDFELELFLATRYSYMMFATSIPVWVVEILDKKFNSKFKIKYWDFVFKRALLPHHELLQEPQQSIAISLAYIRGHILKMPPKLLLKHTSHKLWKGLVESILGKSYFLKEDNKKG